MWDIIKEDRTQNRDGFGNPTGFNYYYLIQNSKTMKICYVEKNVFEKEYEQND